ncbi:MAG: hypothetical protein IKH61_08175 [Bacteroidales bacterium]|nr:hypothetical protein [Bacteroidales bacterium]
MRKTKTLKTIAFSLGLAAGMMLSASASAQGVFGDLLDNYYSEKEESGKNHGMMNRQGSGTSFGTGADISGLTFVQEDPTIDPNSPIGSGIAILMAAGAGYALLKRKEETK